MWDAAASSKPKHCQQTSLPRQRKDSKWTRTSPDSWTACSPSWASWALPSKIGICFDKEILGRRRSHVADHVAGVHQVPDGGEGRAQGGVQVGRVMRNSHQKIRQNRNKYLTEYSSGWSIWTLFRKLMYFISCLIDIFLFLVWHLSNSIYNTYVFPVITIWNYDYEYQHSMDSKSLRSEFDAFDTDGNGLISKDEFMAVSELFA